MKKDEEEEDGAESLISSCLSMKSDQSKDLPLYFSNEPGPSDTNVTGLPLRLQKMKEEEEEEDGAESLTSSCPSMKSDRSKDLPLYFSNEPGPSDTKCQHLRQRAEFPVSNCLSMSDWSEDHPPEFSNEHEPSDT
ncbi:NACHT%2C LRR and PYD domains-containing protein 12-like isoform X6, partial [Scomber scombrus]